MKEINPYRKPENFSLPPRGEMGFREYLDSLNDNSIYEVRSRIIHNNIVSIFKVYSDKLREDPFYASCTLFIPTWVFIEMRHNWINHRSMTGSFNYFLLLKLSCRNLEIVTHNDDESIILLSSANNIITPRKGIKMTCISEVEPCFFQLPE